MFVLKFLYLLTLFIGASKAQISKCPTADERVTTADGSIYAVCQQTDYEGTTTKAVSTIATLADCVRACNKERQCTKAVYDKTNFQCYLKTTNGLNWVSNTAYTTIRFLSKPTEGSQIQTCPTEAPNITTPNGVILSTCPNTEYEADIHQYIGRITSVQACAAECAKISQCTRAMFERETSECFIITDSSELRWNYNSSFDSVRTIARLSKGSRITSCPGGFTNITTEGGAGFATCKLADFSAPSLETLRGVSSVKDCAESCISRANCVHATHDTTNKICYIKGNLTSPVWVFDPQLTSLQLANTTSATGAATKGRWSSIIQFPIIPVATYVVPEDGTANRLLVFSSWGDRAFSGPTGITQFADYNFVTGAVSKRTVTNTQHDMFCPGISSIMGGKIVITGGENAEAVSIYDPKTNQFTRAADMVIARGYQTSATLSDGRVFTIGGSFTGPLGGKTGEVYNPVTNKWTLLQGTSPTPFLTKDREGIWREDNHAWLFGWRNGSVFQAGPSKAMNWYYTANGGSSKAAGTRTTTMDQMCGVNVMYDTGKILTAGGSQDYTDSLATKMAHRITITNPGVAATVKKLRDMNWPRGFANAVVLPDGKVIVTGGQVRSLVFTDYDSILVPEMWDPKTELWTELAPAAVPRNYHSVSILLADGRVFVGGGGMCPAAQGDDLSWCDRAKDHYDGEIYSPPYLFTSTGALAPRPTISTLSVTTAAVGATVTVTLQNGLLGATFSLVRMGSATHSINSDQRRVPVTSVQSNGAGKYTIRLPNDSGVLIPGPWYLFALSKEGVPSVARTLHVRV